MVGRKRVSHVASNVLNSLRCSKFKTRGVSRLMCICAWMYACAFVCVCVYECVSASKRGLHADGRSLAHVL